MKKLNPSMVQVPQTGTEESPKVKDKNALYAGPLNTTGRLSGVTCKVAASLVRETPLPEKGKDTCAGAIL